MTRDLYTNKKQIYNICKTSITYQWQESKLWNDEVKKTVAVRYSWLLVGEANLQNKEDLPAFPFEKKIIIKL